jgi:2-dehydropantoate 2-reductase
VRSDGLPEEVGRMKLTIVGAGAIGGAIGAHMARAGHDILLCDVDRSHVEAINREGLRIEGPVAQFTVRVPAVTPEGLPSRIEHAAIAVKSQHTADAAGLLRDRLAPDGWVLSLQNGMTTATIGDAVGRGRVMVGFVNFGADVVGPGRIMQGNIGTFRVGEPDVAAVTERVAAVADALPWAQPTDSILGYLWGKEAYGAMLWAGAVSDLSIADHLEDPRYRPLMLAVAREVLAQAPCEPLAFDGFDPHDLEGSLDRLVTFNRGSAKSHSGIYRDLMVRRRPTEVGELRAHLRGPITNWVADLIESIERGERTCEVANLDLLVALERAHRLGGDLDAVVHLFSAPPRAAAGPLHGVPIAVKDLVAVRGTPTGNGNPADMAGAPAGADAEIVARLRAAGADVFATTTLLEYAAGALHPDVPETLNPWDRERTAGGSSGGSAALVACGACAVAIGTDTGGSIRLPAHYCATVGFKPTHGALPAAGVTALAPSLDHVGLLTSDVAWAARTWTALSGEPVSAPRTPVRIGVLAAQLRSPALASGVADALAAALERLRADVTLIGTLVDVDDAPLRAIDATFDAILGWEAWQELGSLAERAPERLGPETLRLLRGVADVTREQYEDALATREELSGPCARVYESVDVLLGPAAPFVAPATTPPIDTEEGELEALFTRMHNVTGTPALVLPCGWSDGLPVGLQLSAAPGRDSALLAAAASVETVLAFARPATAGVELPAPAAGWTISDPADGAVEVAR